MEWTKDIYNYNQPTYMKSNCNSFLWFTCKRNSFQEVSECLDFVNSCHYSGSDISKAIANGKYCQTGNNNEYLINALFEHIVKIQPDAIDNVLRRLFIGTKDPSYRHSQYYYMYFKWDHLYVYTYEENKPVKQQTRIADFLRMYRFLFDVRELLLEYIVPDIANLVLIYTFEPSGFSILEHGTL